MKHLFIINPAAGKYDHTVEYATTAERICKKHGLEYEIALSTAPGDCARLARAAAETGEEVRLYACGGDGTLNEVVSGAAGYENVAVTHFPGGSGNDFIKIFSEQQPFHHLERLLDCEEARFDLIRCNDRYALNIMSIGVDARVAAEMVKFKRLPLVSGSGAYLLSLGVNLVKGLSQHLVVQLDGGTPIDEQLTLVCVCNGRWYGGGFNPVPEAEPDDGLLDVLVIRKISLVRASSLLRTYQQGGYRSIPEYITHYRCRTVTIGCDRPSVVNVDGEAMLADTAQIELMPQAVRFFYPRGLQYHVEKFTETT